MMPPDAFMGAEVFAFIAAGITVIILIWCAISAIEEHLEQGGKNEKILYRRRDRMGHVHCRHRGKGKTGGSRHAKRSC